MKLAVAAAALLLSSPLAHAGESYAFEIGGHTITIHAPKGCDSPTCLSVSIPGVFRYGPKSGLKTSARPRADIADEEDVEATASAPAESPASVPVPAQAETAPAPTVEPAVAAPPAPKAAESAPTEAKPAAPAPATPTVVASAPVSAPVQQREAPTPAAPQAANSPLGVWQTEEKHGQVRIEACGSALCGYSIDARTSQNKDKVLIDMRASGARWSGRIRDPKGGGVYDSTLAMKGPDRLRVQGCAFGGMFCGGQTWTRVE